MIILDTNVISEPTRPRPSDVVLKWLNAQDRSQIFVTAISEAEMMGGILVLDAGKRREILARQGSLIFAEDFAGQVLPFDSAAARAFPAVARRVRGKFVMEPDAQIAAIAFARDATLATRNVKHFTGRGIGLVNPWTNEAK